MSTANTTDFGIDRVFRVMSSHVRLRILNLLMNEELCVCDLVNVLNIRQATVSRHLGYLRLSGFVTVRKHGTWMYFRMSEPRNNFEEKLRECLVICRELMPQWTRDVATLTQSDRPHVCSGVSDEAIRIDAT